LAEATAPLTLRFDHAGAERRVHVIGAMQLQPKLRDEFQFYAGASRPGVHGMAIARLSRSIHELRRTDPSSLIVVFPHWGRNYQWAGDKLRQAAGTLTEAGASLIVGHGAHVLQQCSFFDRCSVIYSLGNFMFNWAGRFDRFGVPPFGLVTRAGLSFRDGSWTVDLKIYPIEVDNRTTGHRPGPVDEQRFESVWSALVAADADQSFPRLARPGQDKLGYHIGYSFTTTPDA
jgi:UDP-N-acetylmuramoyl-tripeptide--D-alanyl-D-alanine ligase/cyanophycin synthetase/poly-gamma-glutamate synthesis protein (capsule biosynthesis protein)